MIRLDTDALIFTLLGFILFFLYISVLDISTVIPSSLPAMSQSSHGATKGVSISVTVCHPEVLSDSFLDCQFLVLHVIYFFPLGPSTYSSVVTLNSFPV